MDGGGAGQKAPHLARPDIAMATLPYPHANFPNLSCDYLLRRQKLSLRLEGKVMFFDGFSILDHTKDHHKIQSTLKVYSHTMYTHVPQNTDIKTTLQMQLHQQQLTVSDSPQTGPQPSLCYASHLRRFCFWLLRGLVGSPENT